MALLEARGIGVRFGGTMALIDVDIDVEPACITGLIGPNGAGKTTLFNVITGLQNHSEGRVSLNGIDISGAAPHGRSQRGLARTFQRLELFGSLTGRENLQVAAEVRRKFASGDSETITERVEGTIELTGMKAFASARADQLTTGQARLVELGRALVTKPKVLLLDEPASGLDADETEGFAELLKVLARSGIAILLVEHDMGLVMKTCTQLYVLDFGRIIAVGKPADIRNDPAVIEAYLGSSGEAVV